MNHHYADIRDLIDEEPHWWDEHAVPRYCYFMPGECANIYAREVALLQIECQACARKFEVCMSSDPFDSSTSFADAVRQGTIHYGDPPNIACCPAGATMNSVPLEVLQFWRRASRGGGWERIRDLERSLT